MQPSFPHQPHRSLRSSICERDDDLILFHELQKKERVAASFELVERVPPLKASGGEDIFSSSEWDQHDYDWLMVPPAPPCIPTLDHHHELVGNGFALNTSLGMPSTTSDAILKLGSSRLESPSRLEPSVPVVHRSVDSQDTSVALTSSSTSPIRKSAPSSSSISAATNPSSSMPARSATTVSRLIARPPTPTRSASGAGIRSSTPTGRSTTPSKLAVSLSARQSTPIKRPSTPTRANNPSSSSVKLSSSSSSKQNALVSSARPSSPIKQPATPTCANNPVSLSRKASSSSSKQGALASKGASSARSSSPSTARAHQLTAHPATVVRTLQEQPSSLRADRSLSNSRTSKSSSSVTAAVRPTHSEPTNGAAHTKRPSSSPLVTRGRLSLESPYGHKSSVQKTGQLYEAGKVSLSSGAGSTMMDRVMPPKKPSVVSQERAPPPRAINPQPGKGLKPAPLRDVESMARPREPTGFGRNLSRKSLDMALRHMDIRGTNTSSFRSFMSNVPASSLYSVRSRNGRGNSSSSIASSPMATSSNASSEFGMSLVNDLESSDYFDDTSSDMGSRPSTISLSDSSMAFSNEKKVSHWLGSRGHLDDGNADIMPIFEQGLASLSSPESPLIRQQEKILVCDDFALEPM